MPCHLSGKSYGHEFHLSTTIERIYTVIKNVQDGQLAAVLNLKFKSISVAAQINTCTIIVHLEMI